MAFPAFSLSSAARFTPMRAASFLGGYLVLGLAIVLAFKALLVLAGVLGFLAWGWPGALLAPAGVLALTALSLALWARAAIRRAKDPGRAQREESAGTSEPGGSMNKDESTHDEASSDIITALSALAVSAALLIGPLRLLRIGVRVYSAWMAARTIMGQASKQHAERS